MNALQARIRTWPPLLPAVLLAAVSLCLPWQNNHITGTLSPYLVPGSCYSGYDGYLRCDPGTLAFAVVPQLSGPVAGFRLPIRVFAAVCVVLVILAWRRRSAWLAKAGLGIGLAGLLAGAHAATSGRMVFALALAFAGYELHRVGLLPPGLFSPRLLSPPKRFARPAKAWR